CTCTREFTQESAFTRHQCSCSKGKKRLITALSKAKDLLGSTYSTTGSSSLHPYSASPAVQSPGEVPCAGSSLQGNAHIPASNVNTCTISTEEDGLSLAQRRSRRVDVRMPSRYRQYDDVLPQPPPSVPSHVVQQTEFVSPADSADLHTTTRTPLRSTPFRTARNVFGLVRQFFSSAPPSHDPEEAA
ncbi:hypothetical protein CY34DRAFT_61479, partial [Suillus luteus UH-Slu-Lm8-n1]